MANLDQPVGFQPYGTVLRMQPYVAGGTVYPGDAVKYDSAGKVVVAAASDALCGVANNYVTTGQTVYVYDHPDQLFVGQGDDNTVDAQTDINLNYDILATSGNTTYKTSQMEIDASTQNTTATLPLKVLALEPRSNNALGTNARLVFKINNHQLSAGTGTAGV
jgi:hypothetical protein